MEDTLAVVGEGDVAAGDMPEASIDECVSAIANGHPRLAYCPLFLTR